MPRKQVMVWNSLLRKILTVGDWWRGRKGERYIYTHIHMFSYFMLTLSFITVQLIPIFKSCFELNTLEKNFSYF